MPSVIIRIPPSVYSSLNALVSLDDESFEELAQAFAETPPLLRSSEFRSRLTSKVSLDTEIVNKIFNLTLPLYGLRFDLGVSIDEFMDIFLDAVDNLPPGTLSIENPKEIVARRLPPLLGLDESLGVISKIHAITNEHSRILTDSHIYTELRPIFRDDPEDPPIAGVILHKLKINYIEGEDRKEFFVTLDAIDIEYLRKTLDRAEKKAQSLRTLLSSTGMEILEVASDE